MKVFLVGIARSSHDVLLSVFLLASAIRASGLDAVVRMCHEKHILPDEFSRRCAVIAAVIASTKPDVVGFSVYTWNVKACERIAHLVKGFMPQVVIVFGGPEMSTKYSNPDVDTVIVGEGERAIVELLGGVPVHVPSPYLAGMVPDELLQRDGFKAVVETQRGCSFRCAYCQYHRNFPTIKYMDIATARDEICYAYKHGASAVRIADGNFLSNSKRAIKIIRDLTWRGVKIPLYLEFIPSFCTEEFAQALKDYGAQVTVGIGLQSINPDVLKMINRPTSLDSVTKAYNMMAYAGATVSTDLILGLPLETRASFLAGLDFVIQATREGKHLLHVSELLILPDTEMEQIIKAHPSPMTEGDRMYCARMVAAAYRVLNSDMRAWFYAAGGTIELLDKIASLTAPMDNDLESYWNFHVFDEISNEDLWQLILQPS